MKKQDVWWAWLAWCVMLFTIIAIYRAPAKVAVRYRCIITKEDEVLCFEPHGGRMFRPEKRFDQFILEVPEKIILEVPK